MPFITAKSGLKWHYDLDGKGDCLLFLHGWGVNMLIWRQQFKHFSQSHQVIAIDLPGHGRTEWQSMQLQDMAVDLADIIRQLHLGKVTMVSSSFGGLVALKVLQVAGDLIRRMVFVGTQPKLSWSHDHHYGLDIDRIHELSEQLNTHYPSIIEIFFRSLFTKQERESRRFKWLQTFRKSDTIPQKEALKNFLEILEKEDLREVLFQAQIPVQLINGTEDQICPREVIFQLEEKLPQARVDWFVECGHFPFVSKPHEFNQVLDEFLNSTK